MNCCRSFSRMNNDYEELKRAMADNIEPCFSGSRQMSCVCAAETCCLLPGLQFSEYIPGCEQNPGDLEATDIYPGERGQPGFS